MQIECRLTYDVVNRSPDGHSVRDRVPIHNIPYSLQHRQQAIIGNAPGVLESAGQVGHGRNEDLVSHIIVCSTRWEVGIDVFLVGPTALTQ